MLLNLIMNIIPSKGNPTYFVNSRSFYISNWSKNAYEDKYTKSRQLKSLRCQVNAFFQ